MPHFQSGLEVPPTNPRRTGFYSFRLSPPVLVAAKAIAHTGLDLLTDPSLVQAAKDDFKKQTAGRSYYTAIPPDQKPPLNYRSE